MRILLLMLVMAGACIATAHGQGTATTTVQPTTGAAQSPQGFEALEGRWVRPDGGYMIAIKSVDASGKLDAAYANPRPLPFARAEASREGGTIRVFLELRAGGYNGSTYTLTYDSEKDILKGVYFQAVAQQRYEVQFARAK